jgi:hypothetical protein
MIWSPFPDSRKGLLTLVAAPRRMVHRADKLF